MILSEASVFNLANQRTIPESKAQFKQNWELISFVTGNGNNWATVSSSPMRAPPLPFETIIVNDGEELPAGVDGLHYFIFDNRHPTVSKTRFTDHMEVSCRDHVELVLDQLGLASAGNRVAESLTRPLSIGSKIITFIYKTTFDGWIAIETSVTNSGFEINIYPQANKASIKNEKKDKETLLLEVNGKKALQVDSNLSAAQMHFNVLIDEIDPNLGRVADNKLAEFNPARLKKYLKSVI